MTVRSGYSSQVRSWPNGEGGQVEGGAPASLYTRVPHSLLTITRKNLSDVRSSRERTVKLMCE